MPKYTAIIIMQIETSEYLMVNDNGEDVRELVTGMIDGTSDFPQDDVIVVISRNRNADVSSN